MAMTMQERARLKRTGREMRSLAYEEFLEQHRALRDRLRAGVRRKHPRQFIAEGQNAARLETHDGDSALGHGRERFDRIAKHAPRAIQHPLIVKRTSAAQSRRRERNRESRVLKNFCRRQGDLGLKEVAEGVREQHHRPRGFRVGPASAELRSERAWCEPGQLARLMDLKDALCNRSEYGSMAQGIDQARGERRRTGKIRKPPEEMGSERTPLAREIVEEKLGAVG